MHKGEHQSWGLARLYSCEPILVVPFAFRRVGNKTKEPPGEWRGNKSACRCEKVQCHFFICFRVILLFICTEFPLVVNVLFENLLWIVFTICVSRFSNDFVVCFVFCSSFSSQRLTIKHKRTDDLKKMSYIINGRMKLNIHLYIHCKFIFFFYVSWRLDRTLAVGDDRLQITASQGLLYVCRLISCRLSLFPFVCFCKWDAPIMLVCVEMISG